MAVLVDAGDHTLAKREANAREYAGNLDATDAPNTTTDEKLADGDSYVLSGIDAVTIDSTDTRWNSFILASDKYAAHLIVLGIPGKTRDAEDLLKNCNDIIANINQVQPAQNKPTFTKTGGFNNR